jgi:hypothetical protein
MLAASIVCAAIFASAAMATPPSGVALNLVLGRATLPEFEIQPDELKTRKMDCSWYGPQDLRRLQQSTQLSSLAPNEASGGERLNT